MKDYSKSQSLAQRAALILMMMACYITGLATANDIPALIPQPQKVEWKNEKFVFAGRTNIQYTLHESDPAVVLLKQLLGEAKVDYSENAHDSFQHISLKLVDNLPAIENNKEEAYTISVDAKNIWITAISNIGLYRGVQTLRQMLIHSENESYLPGCTVTDWPAFRIRGFMHDVGRSFISIEELKKQIEILSTYKINVFHWHLTEDLAWRLQSALYPELTDTAFTQRFKGKFYTQEQVRDLVAFCKQHHVLLIPEIDMPGHSAVFRRSFKTDMQSPEGKPIVKKLLAETCDLFDVPYIHIGTDEVHITDPGFVPEMVQLVREKGKEVIGWMPGSELGGNAMRHMWTGSSRPRKGVSVIDSRFLYINHTDPFADLAGIWNSNICDAAQGSDELAGAIVCAWNDRKLATENDILAMNGFYPMMLTIAERSWVGGGAPFSLHGVNMGLPGEERFNQFREFESRLLAHKQKYFDGLPFSYVQQTNILWRITNAFPNKGNLETSFPPEQKLQSAYSFEGKTYHTKLAAGAAVYLRHTWGDMVKSFYEAPKPNSTAYAFTWVYSPKSQEVGMWIGFHNFGRSEKDATPLAGKWDYKESRIWLNDEPVQAPSWKNAGFVPKNNEFPYVDENFESRMPTKVQLKKGWNKLLLKAPVGKFTSAYTRLVKWMFTAVFVSPDGQNAVEGLVYSPDKLINK